jgi:hypothetical protein
VPRISTSVLCGVVCLLVFVGVGFAADEPSRPSETLLPNTAQGFFAISNVDTLTEHWDKTQLGHLMADPVMKPFTKDIRRQFEERWSSVHERLGLTLEDLKGVPGGDVAISLIAPAPGKAALAIVADVVGKIPQANEMLKKVSETQLKRGAKRSELKVDGCPDIVIQFDLPQLEEDKKAAESTLRGSEKAEAEKAEKKSTNGDDKAATGGRAQEEPPARQAFYCLTGRLLVVTDNLEIMKGILARAMAGNSKGSLAEHKAFRKITERCRKDYGKSTPQIRWFIHPLGYAEAARAATPPDQRRKGKSILEVMRNQGVSAVQGVGGFLDFASEGHEMVHRTAVYAPGPYQKAMKMLVLPNRSDFAPQPWVPREISTYTTLYFDIQNAFNNVDSMVDELFGQGETGTWKSIKENLKHDPYGVSIDLDEDLIKHLGTRVSVLTDYQLPISTTSERLLFAIEAKNPKQVAKGIELLFKTDKQAKKREVGDLVIWEIVEEEAPTMEEPKITFGDAPAVAPVHSLKKRKIKKIDDDEEEDDEPKRLLPHLAITVWEGNLLVASHIDFLKKVVQPNDKTEFLCDDIDFELVTEEIDKFATKEKCLRAFSRTDEEYRPTYELVRQNKMPESEGLLAKLLNALFGEGKRGEIRKQKIDGSQLPDYQIVRRYLGPAGLQATSEKDGWYIKGFTQSKEEE